MFLKKKSVALIDFENLAGASQAKEYLNNLVYFGQALKVDNKTKNKNSKIKYKIFK